MSLPVFLKLKSALLENGYYQRDLAKITGKSDGYCQARMTARSPWDLGDVYKIMKALRLEKKDMHLYFSMDGKTEKALETIGGKTPC